ncbi:arf-GAP with Rho-GAP domain, ANK repeat and PH domain-containing protein 1 isoform X4 [Paramormyrops kingsleyae]|uniref:arf-GAP with Rho-GAP domain, ANK repeat and PH domain-containing protein 1 isoform X4 n=1 Tax=Paramormyrops kingsleyae TaxID=1676925 RepID=UPI000CD5F18E|nr:arf-GAP with Rho-GAP domain, ANK repeat and PH domain-containing protein 1 isoform X4 [Paramormyrops kingsleyae]
MDAAVPRLEARGPLLSCSRHGVISLPRSRHTMSSGVTPQPVSEWLATLHLEQYAGAFQAAGLGLLPACRSLGTGDLERLGVLLPGHQRRILASLLKAFPAGPEEVTPVPRERTRFRRPLESPAGGAAELAVPCKIQDKPPPPIPPRVTLNRPPVRFTPTPVPRMRPETLSLKPVEQYQLVGVTLSPVSPVSLASSSSFSSSSSSSSLATEQCLPHEQCSSQSHRDKPIPPLPPKSYPLGSPKEPHAPPPLPQRPPVLPQRLPSPSAPLVDDTPESDRVPDIPPRIGPPSQAPAQPPVPKRRLQQKPPKPRSVSISSSEDYEDLDVFQTQVIEPAKMAEKDEFLVVPKLEHRRLSSLYSDDEILDDDGEAASDPANRVRRHSWKDYGLSTLQDSVYLPSLGRITPSARKEDPSPPLSPVIRQGWLDKNPPQGSLIYQRRWVKLDADYLRYFDSEKDIYSKRIIPTSSITSISNVGEQKFEVVTHNRTFAFRAESDLERSEWVSVIQDAVGDHRSSGDVGAHSLGPSSVPPTPEMQGYLELRGLRSKLYVVVSGDKVFLYKNLEDYKLGIGITSIEMNVGNVKDTDRRSFDLITPYRIFSFAAESDQLKEQWVEAMRESVAEALSNYEVAKKIWSEESNRFCADCRATMPEWAAINLCVVFCKRCAGEHRGLGPSISKVRSLKMDKKVWTEELIQLFRVLGNERANLFWAANVPPSEDLVPASCSDDRRRFIAAKYREGKYRRYHQLFGNQQELDNALCINVQSDDVLETLSLVFCGASVNCDTGNPEFPTTISLAQSFNQKLQVELLSQNRNTEVPRSEVGGPMDTVHYMAPPSITHNGFLFKTASMARPITERKSKEEFSRRWCTLNDGNFHYYESDKNATPNGGLKMKEIVCLAVNPPERHGYDYTFEIYSDSERLYLFGADSQESVKEWVKSITKSFIPASAEDLLNRDFERIGRLKYKDGLNLQSSRVGCFALVGSMLHTCFEDSGGEEVIHLRKLQELSIQQENEVLVLVERGRTLYIEGERKLDFLGWSAAIQQAARSSGDTLCQQQLTESDIPVIVDRCVDYITQCGLTSEGIYRKSGVNSKIAALLESFRRDARSVRLKEGEHQVDDVSNVLKRFFRDVEGGIFTSEASQDWLSTTGLTDETQKISQYQFLLGNLPRVNKATLRALVNHLYCIQCFADMNQMNLHNLAIVFGPTLFQTDGKDYNAGRVVEELIEHYVTVFNVNEQQLQKQLDEITVIIKVRENLNAKVPPSGSGDFICTVYLEEKKETAEQHVKIPATMIAAELTFEILDRRKISVRDKDYWCCFEVNEKDETERPLHYQEKVLPVLHSLGTDSYLVVKKHISMEAMLVYLASKVEVSKHGMMKFREERNLLGLGLGAGSFHDRYFILSSTSLRLYKEVRSLQKFPQHQCSNRPEKEWPVKNLRVYQGIRKKLRPPTCWGLTVVHENEKHEKPERQQWYLCCDTQADMREWFATFMSIQHEGSVWPADTMKVRANRTAPLDVRLAFQKCMTVHSSRKVKDQ